MPFQRPPEKSPLERWMQVALNERYHTALQEPIPDTLLRLLDGERDK